MARKKAQGLTLAMVAPDRIKFRFPSSSVMQPKLVACFRNWVGEHSFFPSAGNNQGEWALNDLPLSWSTQVISCTIIIIDFFFKTVFFFRLSAIALIVSRE